MERKSPEEGFSAGPWLRPQPPTRSMKWLWVTSLSRCKCYFPAGFLNANKARICAFTRHSYLQMKGSQRSSLNNGIKQRKCSKSNCIPFINTISHTLPNTPTLTCNQEVPNTRGKDIFGGWFWPLQEPLVREKFSPVPNAYQSCELCSLLQHNIHRFMIQNYVC